jgi:hypothetical protein
LLALAELPKHSIQGEWGRRKTDVGINRAAENTRFLLPVLPNGSYDLEVRFTLTSGDAVRVMLPVGERSCSLMLGGPKSKVSGFGLINGENASRNASAVKVGLPAGVYKLNLHVLLAGDQATLEAEVNSSPLARWQGPASALSLNNKLQIPEPGALGLGADKALVVFHTARLRVLSGTAQRLEAPR